MLSVIVATIENALPKGLSLQQFSFNIQGNGKFWMSASAGVPGFDVISGGVELDYSDANIAAAVDVIIAELGAKAVDEDVKMVDRKVKLDAYMAAKK